MTPLLQVVGLKASYGHAPVIHGIDLEVNAGEIVGMLGANGAGKTTLLRALSGTTPKSAGEITLDGRPLRHVAPVKRVHFGLGHVPEGRHIFGALTVLENLQAGALVGQGQFSTTDVFALFPRLEERASQVAKSLSGGEQQMLAIARAILTGPKVLMVDEMSAGLAPIFIEQLVDGLVQLRDRGVAMLLVEQSPHFIAEAVSRVYLLQQGQIVGDGTFEQLGGPDRLAELYLGVELAQS